MIFVMQLRTLHFGEVDGRSRRFIRTYFGDSPRLFRTDGISARWEGWRQTIKLLAIGKGSNCRPEPSFVGADRQIERSRSLFHVERRWRISHFWSGWSYEKHSFRDTSRKSTVWLTNRNRRTVYDQVKTKPLNLETLPLWMSKFVNKSVCRMNSAKEHWRDITFCVEESEKKAHSNVA